MEEFLLRRILAADELHVVDHQQIDRAELLLEVHCRAEPQRPNELVHEFLGRQVDHLAARGVHADMPGDGMHQMGLAEADAAIEEERVERHGMNRAGAGLGDPPGGRMRQLVGLADDEVLEGETRVERRREGALVVGDFGRDGFNRGDVNRGDFARSGFSRGEFSGTRQLTRCAREGGGVGQPRIDDQREACDRRVLAAPQGQKTVGVVGRHPVAQKPRRRRDHRLALADPLDLQRLEPGAVGSIAKLVPEAAQHPGPLADSRAHGMIALIAANWFSRHSVPLGNARFLDGRRPKAATTLLA